MYRLQLFAVRDMKSNDMNVEKETKSNVESTY